MEQDKNWMLMTYYCPIHGDSGLVKPIQLTKKVSWIGFTNPEFPWVGQ